MGHSVKEISLRGKFIGFAGLPQETRKISDKHFKFTVKRTRKKTTNKDQSRRKKIIKIRAKIIKMKSKKSAKDQ